MLEASFIKRFGSFVLNAKFEGDGIICVTGKNGAGKTTLLKCIAGFYTIDSGYIKLDGVEIQNLPIEKRKIAFIDNNSYIPNLKVDEHIRWNAKNYSLEKIDEIKSMLGINYSGKVAKLSLGQRIRVAVATALMSNPRMILIDEAFSHISQKEEFIKNFIDIAKKEEISVIFTTQSVDERKFASQCFHLENGEIFKI